MMFSRRAAALLLGATLIASSALPARADDALTDQQVSKTIVTLRALEPLTAKFRSQMEEYAKTVKPDPNAPQDPCVMTPEKRNAPGFKEMDKTIKKNGFADSEAFCRTMLRTASALEALVVDENRPALEQQAVTVRQQIEQKAAEAKQKVQSDPNLTPEQRQQQLSIVDARERQYLAQWSEHPAIRAARTVPESDKAAVAAHRAELDSLRQAPAQ